MGDLMKHSDCPIIYIKSIVNTALVKNGIRLLLTEGQALLIHRNDTCKMVYCKYNKSVLTS